MQQAVLSGPALSARTLDLNAQSFATALTISADRVSAHSIVGDIELVQAADVLGRLRALILEAVAADGGSVNVRNDGNLLVKTVTAQAGKSITLDSVEGQMDLSA